MTDLTIRHIESCHETQQWYFDEILNGVVLVNGSAA